MFHANTYPSKLGHYEIVSALGAGGMSEVYVSPYFIAAIYAGLRNNDEAFAWLEKAYQERHPYLILMEVVFDDIRGGPRFLDLKRRVGLPVE